MGDFNRGAVMLRQQKMTTEIPGERKKYLILNVKKGKEKQRRVSHTMA
jgi:hypothetical protein